MNAVGVIVSPHTLHSHGSVHFNGGFLAPHKTGTWHVRGTIVRYGVAKGRTSPLRTVGR